MTVSFSKTTISERIPQVINWVIFNLIASTLGANISTTTIWKENDIAERNTKKSPFSITKPCLIEIKYKPIAAIRTHKPVLGVGLLP